ncbi:MAG: endo-1,4-beta-xylanase [Phycisphaerae bacterium]|nr:endo-1,4-beta-xylanase [Phycisphaerae bacterium]
MTKQVCILGLLLSCFCVVGNADSIERKGRGLRDIVAEKCPGDNVYIGAATGIGQTNGPIGKILKQEFSYLTPENDFKQHLIHPQPGKWNWKNADAWVKFAKENKQVIRIHGPISPQCSRWANDDSRTAKELETNLKEYMTAMCKRYNSHHKTVRWLDVVNETVSNSGKWMMPLAGTDKWENPWPKIGFEKDIPPQFTALKDGVPLYIIQAFEIANKEAPNIKLVINQHGNLDEKVWAKIKDLVLYLRWRGLRVDGIGWQGHVKYMHDKNWSTDGKNLKYLSGLIAWAHKNKLEFHVTENNIHDKVTEPDKPEEYAQVIGNILKTVLAHRDTGVVTWNLWGINDRPHYNQKELVIRSLWDKNNVPNKSYYRVQEILEDLPYDNLTAGNDVKVSTNSVCRGEKCFAGENVIDGNLQNKGHGSEFPSWGPDKREDLWLKIEFAEKVTVDRVDLLIRADFPHDSYWHTAKLEFSDGSSQLIKIEKTAAMQTFTFDKRQSRWVKFTDLVQEKPLGWCGFTEVIVWGYGN